MFSIHMHGFKLYTFILLIVNTSVCLGQNISDRAFKWQRNDNCWQFDKSLNDKEVFVITEKRARVNNLSMTEIDTQFNELFIAYGVDRKVTGTFKLKIFISKDTEFCVSRLGYISGKLPDELFRSIVSTIEASWHFSPARQRERAVDYFGTVYLSVMKGKLKSVKLANLDAKN